METRQNETNVINSFDNVVKTGLVETKFGNIQVFDPEFWRNPTVWKAPDGTFVPTASVITTALYLGTILGTGLSSGAAMFEAAHKFMQTVEGHTKAGDLLMGLNKTILNETVFNSRRNIAIQISSFFTGLEFVNIKAALKFRENTKGEYNNTIPNAIESEMESDKDTAGILKANFVKNYLALCLTHVRRRKSTDKRVE